MAAGSGGADLLDVACDPELVNLAFKVSGLPICVSSVDPELFLPAVSAGAAMVDSSGLGGVCYSSCEHTLEHAQKPISECTYSDYDE